MAPRFLTNEETSARGNLREERGERADDGSRTRQFRDGNAAPHNEETSAYSNEDTIRTSADDGYRTRSLPVDSRVPRLSASSADALGRTRTDTAHLRRVVTFQLVHEREEKQCILL